MNILLIIAITTSADWKFPTADNPLPPKNVTATTHVEIKKVQKSSVDNPDLTIKLFGDNGIACNKDGCTPFQLHLEPGTWRQLDTKEYVITITKKIQSTQQITQPPPTTQYYRQPVMYYQNYITDNCGPGG